MTRAWPLLTAYVGLVALYAWQAWERATPTLFSDEIEFTQVSRSIADTGRATIRGAEPPSVSLYEYLAAPAWWLDDVSSAYGAIKLLGVLLMTAAIYPAYALARLVVSRPYAVFAAVGAVVAPALSYSPFLVEEPLAYPVSTLALLLIARAGVRPSWLASGLALGACLLALFVRTQLAVLLAVLIIVLLASAWRGERVRSWRSTWTPWDWVGGAVLLVGLAVLLSAGMGRHSYSWYVATSSFKDRMLEYGLWAVGALAIGLGVIPLIAGLAALVRPRAETGDARTSTFVALTASSLGAFGLYTAVKAAYLSTNTAIVIAERNLIYLSPLLFIGTALVLERRSLSLVVTAAATAFALYLVKTTPYALETYPNYETHGLAIAAFANRIPRWPAETIETALVLVALGSGLALVTLRHLRGRALAAVAGTIAVFALTWSLTAEIYAANGERGASDQQYATLPKPPNWVDSTTGGRSAIFVGQGISDPNPFWQLEFWNPSIRWFWGVDGSTPGGVTPNLLRPDGTQDPADLGAEFAVASKGVAIVAPPVTTVGDYVLYRLGGAPVRLRETTTGVAADGWMSSEASYTRYDVKGQGRGFVKVTLSRQGACFPQLEPADATVRVGSVGVNRFDQPGIERLTEVRHVKVRACEPNPVVLRVPADPWRVEVSLSPTFVPNELDPSLGDRRQLGAVLSFEPLRG
ncbi:MAG: hypothetical protein H0V45_14555 [Actinobacteria bacterium]|nr:hypothetical protein [Actinomycetota bacterium]